MSALQELLHRATGRHSPESVAVRAVELWLDNPRGRGDRLEQVLTADPTTVAIPVVWRAICTSRTDLLDRVLDHPPRGRFVAERLRWVPGWPVHPERWLPRQHAAYMRLQECVVADTAAAVRQQAAAIRAAAPIPAPGRELVLRYVDSQTVVLTEAALGALVWTDRPAEALSLRLDRSGDDRARVALYAAGRAVRFVAPSRLPAALHAVLLDPVAKVTSRKESARLLVRYGPPQVMRALLDTYTNPQTDEHPAAIEIAQLLRALRGAGLDVAFERLAQRDAVDSQPAGPGADRLARRRIKALAQGAAIWARGTPLDTSQCP